MQLYRYKMDINCYDCYCKYISIHIFISIYRFGIDKKYPLDIIFELNSLVKIIVHLTFFLCPGPFEKSSFVIYLSIKSISPYLSI